MNCLNVLAVFLEPLRVFTFIPFGTFRIHQLLANGPYYLDKLQNVEQYPMMFPSHIDYLRNYECEKCKEMYCGRDGHLAKLIIQKMNASRRQILRKHAVRFCDLRSSYIHIYKVRPDRMHSLYPMLVDKICILVPAAKPIPLYMNYFLAFKQPLWISTILSILTTLIFWSYIRMPGMESRQIVSNAIYLIQLIFNAPAAINYANVSRKEFCFLLPWSFAGIVLTNMYLSALFSLTTQPLYETEIDSIEMINERKLRIVGPIAATEFRIRKENLQIDVINEKNFYGNFLGFNTNMGYISHLTDAIALLNWHQQRSNKRGFHIMKEIIDVTQISYLVRQNSPFRAKFNEILFSVFSSGIYYKWIDDTFSELQECKLLSVKDDLLSDSTSNDDLFEFFKWPIVLLLLGHFISFIIFSVEFVSYQFFC